MTTRFVPVPASVDASTLAGAARIQETIARNAPDLMLASVDITPGVDGLHWMEVSSSGEPSLRRTITTSGKNADGDRLRAWALSQGWELLSFTPANGTAEVGAVDPFTIGIRDRVAHHLKVAPWSLDVQVRWALDEDLHARLDGVLVEGLPPITTMEKALELLRETMLASVPGADAGWSVSVDPQGHRARFIWGRPAALPELVPLADLLPGAIDDRAWARIPVGLDSAGDSVKLDLNLGPHTLLVGPTSTGKTACINTMIAGALMRGHDLIIIDPVKGVDFEAYRDTAVAFAETLADAASTLERVYAEKERRTRVLKAAGHVKWSDLPDAIRRDEHIKPVVVVADELAGLLQIDDVPRGLPKDHPYVTKVQEENAHRGMIMALIQRLAAEARFVGIHLILGTQRMDSEVAKGATRLRMNCTSRVQLVKPGSLPDRPTLGMVFAADQIEPAYAEMALLDDGRSRGLAVVAAEGGGVSGLRVAYAPMADTLKMLRDRGVTDATPWGDVQAPVTTPSQPAVGSEWDLGDGVEWR